MTIAHRPAPARSEQGFTLIELLVVIVILGVLAAVAVPVYLGQQRSARDASVVSDVRHTTTEAAAWAGSSSAIAVSSTADYVRAGGKVVRSGANVVNVVASAGGAFTVCGYTADGGRYTSSTSAYLYRSDTGRAAPSTAGCPGDGVAGTSTGGTSSGGTTTGGTTTGGTTTGGTTTGGTATGGTTGGGTSPSTPASSTPASGTPASTTPSTSTPSTSTPSTSTPSATASNAPAPAPSASSTPAAEQWVDCATEGGTCAFTGTRNVRYGLAPSTYAYRTLTNGTPCSNDVFGDPVYGTAKQCAYLR